MIRERAERNLLIDRKYGNFIPCEYCRKLIREKMINNHQNKNRQCRIAKQEYIDFMLFNDNQ